MIPELEGDSSLIPSITIENIKQKVGKNDYDKGEDYYKHQMVETLSVVGTTLSSTCKGTPPNVYEQHIEFGLRDRPILETLCTCPVA